MLPGKFEIWEVLPIYIKGEDFLCFHNQDLKIEN